MENIELVEVGLREIQLTEGPGAQIMILSEVDGERQFPIFIGFSEMDALDRAIHGKSVPRPMTHDLIINVIEATGAELRRVIVDDLREDTFFAKLGLTLTDGTEALVDARPSDALVLAARKSVPIFVASHILDGIGHDPENNEFE